MTEIHIDPNVRIRGGMTYAGLEDISGPRPEPGDNVTVVEIESGLVGHATVDSIDDDKQLIYLDVDWASLRDGGPGAIYILGGTGVECWTSWATKGALETTDYQAYFAEAVVQVFADPLIHSHHERAADDRLTNA
jgi:hypothetical protein